jgi:hypothetical protein
MYYRYITQSGEPVTKWTRITKAKFKATRTELILKFLPECPKAILQTRHESSSPAQDAQRRRWQQLGALTRLRINLTTFAHTYEKQLTKEDTHAINKLVNTIQEHLHKIRGGG